MSSDPCFLRWEGPSAFFRIFPRVGFESLIRKSDRRALLWPALGDRDCETFCYFKWRLGSRNWETDFYTPPVLGGAALSDNSEQRCMKFRLLAEHRIFKHRWRWNVIKGSTSKHWMCLKLGLPKGPCQQKQEEKASTSLNLHWLPFVAMMLLTYYIVSTTVVYLGPEVRNLRVGTPFGHWEEKGASQGVP